MQRIEHRGSDELGSIIPNETTKRMGESDFDAWLLSVCCGHARAGQPAHLKKATNISEGGEIAVMPIEAFLAACFKMFVFGRT
jgi:hypothetical protein